MDNTNAEAGKSYKTYNHISMVLCDCPKQEHDRAKQQITKDKEPCKNGKIIPPVEILSEAILGKEGGKN